MTNFSFKIVTDQITQHINTKLQYSTMQTSTQRLLHLLLCWLLAQNCFHIVETRKLSCPLSFCHPPKPKSHKDCVCSQTIRKLNKTSKKIKRLKHKHWQRKNNIVSCPQCIMGSPSSLTRRGLRDTWLFLYAEKSLNSHFSQKSWKK